MKIFSAYFATETNTFSPIPTGKDDFYVLRPADINDKNKDHLFGSIPLWEKMSNEIKADFIWSLAADAPPAGRTVQSVYEGFRDEILSDLKAAMPVDIVFLVVHGAMVAQYEDDCEGDLIARIRSIVGPYTVIGVEIDPHCHLTKKMTEMADLIIIFKEYPHVDMMERARELFDLAVKTKQGEVKPTKAVFDCRMVKFQPTSVEPMRSFVDSMTEREKSKGVLSLSLAHGFPYGDVAEAGTRMLAITDNDPDLAKSLAKEFGQKIIAQRHQDSFKNFPVAEALSKAAAAKKKPIVVADQADNAGGGAPSDSTFALKWLLDNNITNAAIAYMWDPIVVQIAKAAGQGATLDVRLGGKMGTASGDPLDLAVTVTKIIKNYELEIDFLNNESAKIPLGDCAAFNCCGIDIIVTSERGQCFTPTTFNDFGIDPANKQILIPKSTQHFYAGFEPMAAEIIYMTSPGALNPDISQIPFKVMDKNKFPWKDDPFKTD